jgi:hypothetical protein
MKNTYDWVNDVLAFRNTAGEVSLSLADVPEGQREWLLKYGLKQWLGSYLAKAANGTAREYLETAGTAFARARAGEFLTRAGGNVEALMPRAFEILAQKAGKPKLAAEWLTQYNGLTVEEREKTRGRPAVKAAIDAARAERRVAAAPSAEGEFNPFA